MLLARVLGGVIVVLLTASTAHAQGTWTSRAPMPTARSAPAIGVLGSAVHLVAGYQGGGACTYLNTHEAYDPATDTWSTKAPLSWNPDQPGGAVVQGQLFVIGGLVNCGGSYRDVASYHPSTNSWTPRALLPAGRGAFGTGVIDNIIYVVGGSTGQAVVNTVYAYNIANNTWAVRASMPTARMGLATAVVDGILYAIGGWNGSSGVATVEAYDPGTNTWTSRAPMPVARSFISAAAVGGKVYVMGGGYSSPDTNEVRVYDPATNTWGSAPPMPTARGYTGSAVANGVIYTVGGFSAAIARNTNEAFTPPGAAGALSASPSSIDFGAQSRNTTSGPRTATLGNTGPGPLSVSAVTTTGPFAVSGTCGAIQPGGNCALAVTFTPTSDGALAGGIAISSSGGPAAVALSGVGERSLVVHYYRSILRRDPDAGGKAFWESEAARLAAAGANVNEAWFAMAMAFYFSPEYAAFNRDNQGFVTDLYNTFFNRAPDAGGLAYWKGQLDQGMPREVLLASFMFSSEFSLFTQSIFGNTSVRREIDTVFDFYRGLLSRLPDNGGLDYWIGQFRSAQCSGNAGQISAQAESISAAFVSSGEYAARGRSNAQFVGDLYNAFLRRGGDMEGVSFWIAELASGRRTRDQVRLAFVASPEFSARVSAVAAQGCQPSITSVAASLAPLTAASVSFVGLDPAQPIVAQYTGPGGFTASLQAVSASAGVAHIPVPVYAPSATSLSGSAAVSLVLKQGNLATTPAQVTLLPLPRASDYGLVLGEASRALLRFQIMQLGRRVNQFQAARLLLGADTAGAEAALRNHLKLAVKAKADVDKVFANNATVIAVGTTSRGHVVRMDRDVLEAMDRVALVYLAWLVDTGAASSEDLPKKLYDPLLKAAEVAGVIKTHQDAFGSTDPEVFARAAAGAGGLFLGLEMAGTAANVFAERFGASLALFDIGRSAVDVLEDLGSLYVNTTYGGDPGAIQKDLDNLARHRLDLLNNSVNTASFGLVNVVPAGTPGALNLAGFALTSNVVDLVASGVEAAMQSTTRAASNQLRNPFPPNKGFGRITGGSTNMPPEGSIHLCCIAGAEIETMPDEAGSYSLVVPLDVPGTNYGSMTLKVVDVISNATRGSTTVNLSSLPTVREIAMPTLTIARDCYAEYEACAAPCVPEMGASAFAQCVNACLAAFNACLNSP